MSKGKGPAQDVLAERVPTEPVLSLAELESLHNSIIYRRPQSAPQPASQPPEPPAVVPVTEPEPKPWVDPLVLRERDETRERDKAIRAYLDQLKLTGTERNHLREVLLKAWEAGRQQIIDRYPPDFPTTR
jgi:hypothetical protein